MKKEIYLMRHSNRLYVWSKTKYDNYMQPLTPEGEEKARNLTKVKEFLDVDQIYASPTARAISTLKYVAEKLKKEINIDERIIERESGIKGKKGVSFYNEQWNNFDYKVDGGESLRECQDRMLKFVNDVLGTESKKILVCTHGQALATLLHYYGIKITDFVNPISELQTFKLIFENKELKKIDEVKI